jgi:hypothetical protein
MITFRHKGNFDKTIKFLSRDLISDYMPILDKYGKEGVQALSAATPIDSGKTRDSWSYQITRFRGGVTLTWLNSNVVEGVPIAILIQYGHGTSNGGYVEGRDFINPAIRPVFDRIANEIWGEVIK